MARTVNPKTLSKMINDLRNERRRLEARLAAIDQVFSSLNLAAGGAAGGLRGRRTRGSFSMSGEASVLAFIAKHGRPNAAEVNKHWADEGRGGRADNALTKLVKQKKLKRIEVADERGSRYSIA